MKKFLLLTAVAFSALSANAQLINKEMTKSSLPMLMVQQQKAQDGQKAIRKSKSETNNCYYTLSGGLWRGWSADGWGTGYSIYAIAPWVDYELNPISDKTYTWSINGKTHSDYSYIPESGVYTANYYAGGWFYAPTIQQTTGLLRASWNIGDNNVYGAQTGSEYKEYKTGLLGTDSIVPLYPTDDHAYYEYQGQKYSNVAAWGLLDTDNLYGSGNYIDKDDDTGEETVYASYAADQPYKALNSPLYVESIVVKGVTFTQPIPEGKKLSCYICNSSERTRSDGSIDYEAGEEIIETLYAESADTLDFTESMDRNSKTIYIGAVRFSKKTTDAFGNETIEPFIIPAGQDFVIVIAGLDQEGVDFGFEGLEVPAEDETARPAHVLITDGEYSYSLQYQSVLTLNMAIEGMFDNLDVPSTEFLESQPSDMKLNVLRVSADGKTVTTDGQAAGSDYDLQGSLVGTAITWFDEEENENYTMDVPEWITGALLDTSLWSGENIPGYNYITFECEPLPAGTTGRKAEIYVEGKGVKAATPIIVLQGDAVDGIENIIADKNSSRLSTNIYNVAGQSVNNGAKGILIKNGKKFIND